MQRIINASATILINSTQPIDEDLPLAEKEKSSSSISIPPGKAFKYLSYKNLEEYNDLEDEAELLAKNVHLLRRPKRLGEKEAKSRPPKSATKSQQEQQQESEGEDEQAENSDEQNETETEEPILMVKTTSYTVRQHKKGGLKDTTNQLQRPRKENEAPTNEAKKERLQSSGATKENAARSTTPSLKKTQEKEGNEATPQQKRKIIQTVDSDHHQVEEEEPVAEGADGMRRSKRTKLGINSINYRV